MYDLNLATCGPIESLERTIKQTVLSAVREKLGSFDDLPPDTAITYGISAQTLNNVYSSYAPDQFTLIGALDVAIKVGLNARLLLGEE